MLADTAHRHRVHHDKYATTESERLQRSKYGGFNFGAAFFGWLVANSVSVLLIALLSALGSAVALTVSTAGSLANNAATVGIVGGILLLLTLAIAYYAGGYVAGRMSRFDGGKQGLGVWLMGIIITIILGLAGALLGSSFNLMQQLNLPSIPMDGSSFTIGGLITLIAIIVVSILAAIGGGKMGERYHHKVDEAARAEH